MPTPRTETLNIQTKPIMKVLVVYHTTYGHTLQLARAVEAGVKSVAGVEAVFRRAPEFPHVEKELEAGDGYATKIWKDQKDIQPCTLDDLKEADGLLLGSPTRYGNMCAPMKALIDSTASLWLAGAMEGKPAGVFTSTATTHGGQETTCLTMMIPLIHLGMLIVGVPYSTEGMLHTEGRGGSPYGASTTAGPKGELAPSAEDLAICRAQGKRVAELAKKIRG
jgi:NAD(P)H dehydrogenase (quinone)